MNINKKIVLAAFVISSIIPKLVYASGEDEINIGATSKLNEETISDNITFGHETFEKDNNIESSKDTSTLEDGGYIPMDRSSNNREPIVYYDKTELDKVIVDFGLKYDKSRVEARKKALLEGVEEPVFPNDYGKQIEEKYEKARLEERKKAEEAWKKEEDKRKAQEEALRKARIEEEARRKEHSQNSSQTRFDVRKPLPSSDIYPKVAVYDRVVDISEHQNPKVIDYDKFANAIDGAILRASIRNKGLVNRKDYAVDRHYKELNRRGIPLGFYHYSRAITEAEAIEEAKFVLNVVKDKKVSLPIYIDIEDHDRQLKATKNQISRVADAFCDFIRNHGYVAGIYSYPWFSDNYLTKEVRAKNEFWIAEIKKKQSHPTYNKSHYDSWQYSSKGGVYGYKYDIDKDIIYRDYPLIMTGVSHKGFERVADEVIDGKWGNGTTRKKRLEYAGYDYNVIQGYVNKRLKARNI